MYFKSEKIKMLPTNAFENVTSNAMLEQLKSYKEEKDCRKFMEALLYCIQEYDGSMNDEEVGTVLPPFQYYIDKTMDIEQIEGPFTLWGIYKTLNENININQWIQHPHYERFQLPVLQVGSFNNGQKIWWILDKVTYNEPCGYVITENQDDFVEILAADAAQFFDSYGDYDSRSETVGVLESHSELRINQLMALHNAFATHDDMQKRRAAVCEIMGWKEKEINNKIQSYGLKFLAEFIH